MPTYGLSVLERPSVSPSPAQPLSRHFLGTDDHHKMGWALFFLLGQGVGPALTCFCLFSETWE